MNQIPIYDTTQQAYLAVVHNLLCANTLNLTQMAGQPLAGRVFKSSPRGQEVIEIANYAFSVANPSSTPITTKDAERNDIIKEYTKREFKLYNSGSRSAKEFAAASSFWSKIANPDGTINSAYGYLLFGRKVCGNPTLENEHTGNWRPLEELMLTPWEWVMHTLITDKDSRQAIFHFNTPDHLWVGNLDVTCTLHGQFLIRNDKLYLTIAMRSNDVVLGLVYDMPWFCSLMERALTQLKPVYPDLTLGSYTHTAGSMHLYLRNLDLAKKMIGLP